MNAMMSSIFCTSKFLQRLVIPPDSSWKMPIVSPRFRRAKVVRIVERDLADGEVGARSRISVIVSSITVSVFRPRKSIFNSPRSLSGPIENWLITSVPFVSRQSGTYSGKSRSPITTPAA